MTCVDDAGAAVASGLCGTSAGVTLTESCGLTPCALCTPSTCSGHGDCNAITGSCTCHSGYHGVYCQVCACVLMRMSAVLCSLLDDVDDGCDRHLLRARAWLTVLVCAAQVAC